MRKWKCFITGQRNSANYGWIMSIAQHQSRDLWLYGDRLLCNFMPFNFKEGISSQDVFAREICTIIFSEITHTPPQKSNGRPLSSVYSFFLKRKMKFRAESREFRDVLYMWCPFHKSYRNKLFCRKINHNDNKWADLRRNWVRKWSRLFAHWSTCHTLIVRLHTDTVLTF